MSEDSVNFSRLHDIVHRLRAPDGCPWDRAQTHESLRTYLLEESREAVVAIGEGSPSALRDELGDVLLQVFLHAVIAEEAGEFTLEDVLAGLIAKLLRRHPHVFGPAAAGSPQQVERRWAEIKAVEAAAERLGSAGVAAATRTDWLAAVPRDMEPMAEAQALGARAAEVGFDWPDVEGAWRKVQEECQEFETAWRDLLAAGRPQGLCRRAVEDELGDLLFSVINVVRVLGLDAELALVAANAKFRRRFGKVEARVGSGPDRLRAAGPGSMDTAWQAVKMEEKRLEMGR